MTDRELLQAAAKAVNGGSWHPLTHDTPNGDWNPLTDDGDALRLAVKLRLHVDHSRSGVCVWVLSWQSNTGTTEHFEEDTGDDFADTRRAIVRAAAAMGSAK